jgi:hypothetical protein
MKRNPQLYFDEPFEQSQTHPDCMPAKPELFSRCNTCGTPLPRWGIAEHKATHRPAVAPKPTRLLHINLMEEA